MLGYGRDELIGMRITDLIPKEDFSRLAQSRAFLLETDSSHMATWKLRRKDGSWLLTEVSAAMFPDGRWQAFVRDISERVRAEEAARTQAELLHDQLQLTETIANYAAEALILLDARGCATYLNPAAERMFGWKQGELRGRPLHNVIHYQHPDGTPYPRQECPLLQALATKRPLLNREDVYYHRDGTPVPVSCSGVPVLRGGVSAGAVLVVCDVTERNALQREILAIAAREQRRIGQDLHDLTGQELTGLGLMAAALGEMLGEQALPGAELAAKITAGLQRALAQVQALSRGLVPVDVDSRGLMAALEELAGQVREQSGLSCTFACAEPVLLEDGATATQLYRLAREAVMNAVKHSRARHVGIRLSRDDQCITLRIQDDGVGIPEPPTETTGLGLRIMHYRAGLINALLLIERAEEGGTQVTCTIAASPPLNPRPRES
jgi:PAS domain S-box-containing protein